MEIVFMFKHGGVKSLEDAVGFQIIKIISLRI